ncbi:MAG: hypothetical protein JWL88_308 [Parcubacteria group bacterium]|nr:hypothetical protein [Parcubacteria group bacterium]
MSSTNTVIAIIVVLVLAVGGYFLFANKATAPVDTAPGMSASATISASSTNTMATGTAMTGPASSFTVTYTDQGFSPKSFNVSAGTAVHFVNDSSHPMWVAVGDHPTHTTYDGTSEQQHCSSGTNTNGSFDECGSVGKGAVYSYTFTKTGTFSFHNHVHASDLGTVTVTQQ